MKNKKAATGTSASAFGAQGFHDHQEFTPTPEPKADTRGCPVDRWVVDASMIRGGKFVSVWSVTGEPVVEMFVGGAKINQGGIR